jgi:hypothetical protein
VVNERAFFFPFKDRDWLSKFLIGSLFILASWVIPIIPLVFVFGYTIQTMRRTIQAGEGQLPAWQDWAGLGMKGVLCLVLYFIYCLPGLVLLAGAVASFVLSLAVNGLTPDDASRLITSPMVLLARLLLLIAAAALAGSLLALLAGSLAAPVAAARLAATGELRAALEIDRIWAIVRSQAGNFVLAWAVYLGLIYVSSMLYAMLYYTICCCILVPIISAPVSFYMLVFAAALFALVYREGEKTLATGPLYLLSDAGSGPVAEPTPTAPDNRDDAQKTDVTASPVSVGGEQERETSREVQEFKISDRGTPSYEVTISELELSPRVERLLLENGFVTVGQLLRSLERDESELLEIKGFGRKALEELRTQLQVRGFIT